MQGQGEAPLYPLRPVGGVVDFETAARASVVTNATEVARESARIAEELRRVEVRVTEMRSLSREDFVVLVRGVRGLAVLLGGAAYLGEIASSLTLWQRVRLSVAVLLGRPRTRR